MADKKKKEKSKDPFHADNIEQTLDDRIHEINVMEDTLQTHASYVNTQISDLLPRDKNGTIKFGALNRRSKEYDPGLEEKAKAKVRELLDPNKANYSPLQKRLEKLDEGEREMVSSLYFPDERQVKEILQRDDWVQRLAELMRSKRNEVRQLMSQKMLYGFDKDTHGENAVKYLVKKLGLTDEDHAYLEKERLNVQVDTALRQYALDDDMSKRQFMNLYGNKKPEKKKKK